MRCKIIKILEKPSKYSKTLPFFYLFLKSSEGKSFKTCIGPQFRNYLRWSHVIEKAKKGEEVWLDGLMIKSFNGDEIVDADSFFSVCVAPPEDVKIKIIQFQKKTEARTASLFPDRGFEEEK